MGSFTAQIIVGQAHPNHGGIIPSHYLFLSENSKPAWVLMSENITSNKDKQITWFPTVENMLQDALLMISVHVLDNKELRDEIKDVLDKHTVFLYDDIGEEKLKNLYELCHSIDFDCKLVVVAFEGSTIRSQLKIFENYKMDLEVCTPVYSRHYFQWTDSIKANGSL